MKVKVEDLHEGCIIAENIMGLTNYPIMKTNTSITALHIEVLQAFQIDYVAVKTKKEDGSLFGAEALDEASISEERQERSSLSRPRTEFEREYHEAVMFYKNEFSNWQSGSKVDIVKLKQAILPVITNSQMDTYVHRLHELCEAKEYIAHHSIAVGVLCHLIGRKMGYEDGLCTQLSLAGVLADAGMAKMPMSILQKSSGLERDEAIEIRKHSIFSYQYIMDTPFLKKEMKKAIYQHHERLDGSGYPIGEKGQNISMFSQIIALADMYHAMTSERLYKQRQSPFKTLEIITEDSFGKFDIVVVKALQDIIGNLTPGTKVQLSDGQHAEVIYTPPTDTIRPVVKRMEAEDILDLSKQRTLFIERIM
ncbi:HD domain-containing phosphohydrolase [Jeotgalibacillus sp. ET6]|uniref:HD-GYP domain-containing protein n=1 Tax=Jeotgalibacillus sp. ET6 TaxID=3037260 RepID=UPI002418233A|nr:HD domain-containing phosphohydrolase [Jeotgalibacillus sp. ET6]MDG5473859.1 HD domain-containing phosphohydrolase [Jeotgalibacillus sp. ET6]